MTLCNLIDFCAGKAPSEYLRDVHGACPRPEHAGEVRRRSAAGRGPTRGMGRDPLFIRQSASMNGWRSKLSAPMRSTGHGFARLQAKHPAVTGKSIRVALATTRRRWLRAGFVDMTTGNTTPSQSPGPRPRKSKRIARLGCSRLAERLRERLKKAEKAREALPPDNAIAVDWAVSPSKAGACRRRRFQKFREPFFVRGFALMSCPLVAFSPNQHASLSE